METILMKELRNPVFMRKCESEFSYQRLANYRDGKRFPKDKVLTVIAQISIESFHKENTLDEEKYRLATELE